MELGNGQQPTCHLSSSLLDCESNHGEYTMNSGVLPVYLGFLGIERPALRFRGLIFMMIAEDESAGDF